MQKASILTVLIKIFLYSQEFVIDSSWRYRSTILTPMFVETQASQSIHRNLSQERSLSASGSVGGRVRATQRQYEFTPTQHVSKSRPVSSEIFCLATGIISISLFLLLMDFKCESVNAFNVLFSSAFLWEQSIHSHFY